MPEQGVKAGKSNHAKEVFDMVLHFPPPALFSTLLPEMAQHVHVEKLSRGCF